MFFLLLGRYYSIQLSALLHWFTMTGPLRNPNATKQSGYFLSQVDTHNLQRVSKERSGSTEYHTEY